MTTEAAFQAALDADPTDWQTRLVFADWLLDRGDMRWEGMRWLGMEQKWPQRSSRRLYWYWWPTRREGGEEWDESVQANARIPVQTDLGFNRLVWGSFNDRSAAEDAFCRAYPALAAAHPAEFAMGVMA